VAAESFAKTAGVVDQSDETDRDNRTYLGDGRQLPGTGVTFGLRLHSPFQIGSRLAQRAVGGKEAISNGAQAESVSPAAAN
jgi:hypothetical protein